jgi:hypothetical protein
MQQSKGSEALVARQENYGSTASKDKTFVSTPKCPEGLWGPPNLLLNGYQCLFTQR